MMGNTRRRPVQALDKSLNDVSEGPAWLRTTFRGYLETVAWLTCTNTSLVPANRALPLDGGYRNESKAIESPQRAGRILCALFCLAIMSLSVAPQAARAQDMQIIAGWTNATPGTYPPVCEPPVPGPIFICNAGFDEGANGNWTLWGGQYLWVPGPVSALGHLHSPNAVAVGPDGSVYVTDQNIEGLHPQVRRIDPSGTISTYALMPPLSTGGSYLATSVAVAGNGNVYYGDNFGNIYVNVQCSQLHNAWVGGYSVTPPGPTAPEWVCTNNTTYPYVANATVLPFTPNLFVQGGGSNQPITALAVDTNNNLYALTSNPNGPEFGWTIAEYNSTGNVLRIVNTTNTAGLSGTYGQSLAVDSLGNIYTVDALGDQLLKIDTSGNVTIVGSGGLGCPNCFSPNQLAVDPYNNLYIITENGSLVVESNPVTQFATNIAGTGTNGLNAPGFTPPVFYPVLNDSFPALQTDINSATGIALGPNGSLYIADTGNNLVRQVVLNPAGSGCQKCGPQSLTLTDPIPTGKVSSYSGLNPSTHQIYVDYPSSNTVTVFSTVDDTVVTNIAIGAAGDILGPIAVDSTNNLIYVADTTGNSISVINGVSNAVIGNPVFLNGSPFAIAVDPGINGGKAYVLTPASVSVIAKLVSGAYGVSTTIPLFSPSALAVDTFRQIVYVRFIGPNGLNEHGGLGSSQNYSMAVINAYTDTLTATPSISYGAPVDLATDSIAVDEGTGKVVVADGFDQFARIYFPSTQAFSFYDPGFYPSHVAVDSINEVYYFADGYGDTAYLNNLSYTSGQITSTPDPGNVNNTCSAQGSVIGVDATTDQVYITTCDVSGADLHLFSGDVQGDLTPTATLQLGTPPNNSGFLSGYFSILVDSSNTDPTKHSVYIENSITNQLDVINGPTPGARPSITISPNPLNFGLVQVGVPTVLSLTVQNTGSANLNLASLAPTILPATGIFQISEGTCNSLTLPSGSSPCTFNVTFTPAALGPVSGSIIFNDNTPDSPQTVNLTGTGVAGTTGGTTSVTISPSSLSFGPVPEFANESLPITVTNSGANPLQISTINFVSGSSTDFSESDSCQGKQIAIGLSCTITVDYHPSPSDTVGVTGSAILQLYDNATTGSPQSIGMTGIPADPNEGYAAALQGSFNFGNVVVNEPSVTAQISVTNSGGSGQISNSFCFQIPGCGNLTMPTSYAFTSTNPNDFQVSLGTCSGATLQPTGAAFGLNTPPLPNTCDITVTFVPSANPQSSSALETAKLSFVASTTNSAGTPVSLPGTILISGISSTLGQPTLPLTSALLVSSDNSVPPNPAAQPQGGILVPTDTASLSSGGQFVAFSVDDASNLPGPANGLPINVVYLRNTCLGPNAGSSCEQGTSFVSIGPNGAACTGESFYPPGNTYPAIDATGQFVAFTSNGCQVTGITFTSTNANQIYLRDVVNRSTSLVSLDSTSSPLSSGVAAVPFSMSANAQFFAYETTSPDVVAGVANPSATDQIYWTSFCTGQTGCTPSTLLVSQDPTNSNPPHPANNTASGPAISADGRYVAFASTATNLVSGFTIPTGSEQVYLRDTCYQAPATPVCVPSTQLISQNSLGSPSTGASDSTTVSSGGRFVVFASSGANMIPVGTPPPASGTSEIYLRDTCYYYGQQMCQTPTTTLLSELIPSSGPPTVGNEGSSSPFISADGRLITFASSSTNLGLSAGGVYEYDSCQANNVPVTPCPHPGLNALYGGGSVPMVDATDQFFSFDIINSSSGYPLSQVYVGQTTVIAPPALNTPAGTNISVTPTDAATLLSPVTLKFSDVTSAGETTVTLSNTGLTAPGYEILTAGLPIYLYVTTTAGYTGNVQVCVNYGQLITGNPSSLELLHFVNGQPPPVVIYPATGGTLNASQICGTVTSLSPFALALPAPTVNPTSLAGGTAGVAYGPVPFTTTGGQGAVNVTESGALPLGMTFSNGTLSGTPMEVGNFPITVTATDSQGSIGAENIALTVSCPTITVMPTFLVNGIPGTAYNPVTFTQTGGVPPITFSQIGVPTPMTFTTTGVLGGTPSQTGSFPLTVYAIDSNSCTGSANVTLMVTTQQQKTTPVVNWTAPAAIPYGTALSATQLNATVTPTIAGTFVYNPPAGTVLGAGQQTLSVTFMPTDTTDYNSAVGNVALTVNTAPLTVTSSAASRAYGAANPTFTAMVTGAVNGDTFTETLATTATATSGVGQYPITVSNVAGANIADYSLVTNNGTLTITKANSTVLLVPTVGSGPTAGTFVLTANVLPGTSGVPTGTVTFTYATTTLGTSPLSTPETAPAVAVLSTPDLPFGTDSVTATYNGDSNFNGNSNPTNVNPSFTIGATLNGTAVSSVTLAAGQSSSQITITATSLTGFDSRISFSCGSLPIYVHCQFTPSTIPSTVPSTPPATTATSLLTISVDSTDASMGKQGRIELATAAPLALLGLLSLLFGKRKRWTLYVGLVLLLTGVAGTLVGCTSASSSSGSSTSSKLPPAGSPVIVIEGTANGGVLVPFNFTVNITN